MSMRNLHILLGVIIVFLLIGWITAYRKGRLASRVSASSWKKGNCHDEALLRDAALEGWSVNEFYQRLFGETPKAGKFSQTGC